MVSRKKRTRPVRRRASVKRRVSVRRTPRRARAARSNPKFGRYRPVLVYGRSGWRLPRKGRGKKRRVTSRLLKRGTRVNPQRPSQYPRVNPRYRRRRSYRRNPRTAMGKIFNQQFIIRAGSYGLGIASGFALKPLVYRGVTALKMPIPSNFLGAGNLVAGLLLNAFMRNRMLKDLGMALAGTGVYDLIAANTQEFLGLPEIPVSNKLIEQLMPMGLSYNVPYSPVSQYSRGVGLSYPARMGLSYEGATAPLGSAYRAASDMVVTGVSGDNPYDGIEGY